MSKTTARDSGPSPLAVLLPVGFGISVAPLDTSVNISLPDVAADFAVQVHAIQWVVICYVLTYSCLLLGLGRLADTVGHRRVFVAGLYWSMVSLAVCATAASFEWLLVGRVMQGIGTAMVLSTGPALMTLSFPAEERSKVVGQYALAFALASAIGPFAGGLLVETWGWPAVYWYRIPVLAMACVLVFGRMTAIGRPAPEENFDLRAAAALTAGLFAALLCVNQAARLGGFPPHVLGLGAGAVVALGWFAKRQAGARNRVIDLSLFRSARFACVNLTHALVNGSTFMILLFGPFYVTRVSGGDESVAGIFLGMFPLGIALSSIVGSKLLTFLGGANLSRMAMAIIVAGLGSIAFWPQTPSYPHLLLTLLLPGLGYGLFQIASLDLVMATMSRREQGVAGSLNMLTRTVGVVVGASLGSLLFAQLAGSAADAAGAGFDEAFRTVFLGATGVSGLCLLILLGVGDSKARRAHE